MTYEEKLRDPRWIDVRDCVLDRDKYTCQWCQQRNGPMNVHHTKYIFGREPWEYPTGMLITLCRRCHEDYHTNGNKMPDRTTHQVKSIGQIIYEWATKITNG